MLFRGDNALLSMILNVMKIQYVNRLDTEVVRIGREAPRLAGQEKGDETSLQRGVFSKRFPKGKHPRFEFAPRDDRSSENEPNRVENDRDTSLQSWKFLTLFLPRRSSGRRAATRAPRPRRGGGSGRGPSACGGS